MKHFVLVSFKLTSINPRKLLWSVKHLKWWFHKRNGYSKTLLFNHNRSKGVHAHCIYDKNVRFYGLIYENHSLETNDYMGFVVAKSSVKKQCGIISLRWHDNFYMRPANLIRWFFPLPLCDHSKNVMVIKMLLLFFVQRQPVCCSVNARYADLS